MFIYMRPHLLLLSLLWGVFTLLTPSALANDGLRLSVDKLIFQGLVNKPLQRTFTLIAPDDDMPGVEVVENDLVDSETKSVLLSNDIKVEHQTPQKRIQRFIVTVTASDAGHFTGNLDFRLKRKTGEEKRTIELDVTTVSPNVDTGSNSKTLTLPIQQRWVSWPWGSPTVNSDSPKLGEITLSLLQNGEGKATIERASVLTMRGSKGNNLPDGAAALGTQLPIDLQRHEAKTLKVVVKGSNMPADEYNGILLISVNKQPNALEVPLRLQVKDGPLLALILLIFGPLAGIVIHWWNSKGLARYQLSRKIENLESQVDRGQCVQMDVKGKLHETLNNAKSRLIAGQEPAEIEKLLEPMQEELNTAVASGEKFLKDELEPLRARVKGMKSGAKFSEKLLQDVEKIEKTVKDGQFPSLDEARARLNDVVANVVAWDRIISSYEALPEPRDHVLTQLEKADTLNSMQQIIDSAQGVKGIARASIAGLTEPGIQIIPSPPTWESFTLGLKVGRIVMAILLYLFTLTVGYITLYAKSPTFGADLENYITLFLWGVSVNIVGVQVIDLKAIYAPKDK